MGTIKILKLFSIHALLEIVTFQCVCIFNQVPDEEVYREGFSVVKNLVNPKYLNLNSKKVMTDFELATCIAIWFNFPIVEIKGS